MLNTESTCVLDNVQNRIEPTSKTTKGITSALTTFTSGQTFLDPSLS